MGALHGQIVRYSRLVFGPYVQSSSLVFGPFVQSSSQENCHWSLVEFERGTSTGHAPKNSRVEQDCFVTILVICFSLPRSIVVRIPVGPLYHWYTRKPCGHSSKTEIFGILAGINISHKHRNITIGSRISKYTKYFIMKTQTPQAGPLPSQFCFGKSVCLKSGYFNTNFSMSFSQ